MEKSLTYIKDGKEYPVIISIKRIKNTYYRYRDGAFYVSTNRLNTSKNIIKGIDKYFSYLTKSRNNEEEPITNEYVYILGKKIPIVITNQNKMFDDHIEVKSIDKLNKVLKASMLSFITERVRFYEEKMGINNHYDVKVRDMKTRLGSNSKKTHGLCFALSLIHYINPVIDSVVVHELAHDKHYDHSKSFYDVVYKYCPQYDIYRKVLLKKNYAYGTNNSK